MNATSLMMMILKRVGIRQGENKGREYKENYAGKPKDDRKPQDKYYRRSRNGKREEQNQGKQEPQEEETEKEDPEPRDE